MDRICGPCERIKGGRRVRLTTLPPSVNQLSRENVGASTSHNPMGLHGLTGIALPFTFIIRVLAGAVSVGLE
jgi:hypothetical protein